MGETTAIYTNGTELSDGDKSWTNPTNAWDGNTYTYAEVRLQQGQGTWNPVPGDTSNTLSFITNSNTQANGDITRVRVRITGSRYSSKHIGTPPAPQDIQSYAKIKFRNGFESEEYNWQFANNEPDTYDINITDVAGAPYEWTWADVNGLDLNIWHFNADSGFSPNNYGARIYAVQLIVEWSIPYGYRGYDASGNIVFNINGDIGKNIRTFRVIGSDVNNLSYYRRKFPGEQADFEDAWVLVNPDYIGTGYTDEDDLEVFAIPATINSIAFYYTKTSNTYRDYISLSGIQSRINVAAEYWAEPAGKHFNKATEDIVYIIGAT